VRDWMNDFFDAFDEGARYEIEEIVVVGDDVVLAVYRFVGRCSRSGAPLVPLCPSSASLPSRSPKTLVTLRLSGN
jgi:ketosteroid isomerase-like protein